MQLECCHADVLRRLVQMAAAVAVSGGSQAEEPLAAAIAAALLPAATPARQTLHGSTSASASLPLCSPISSMWFIPLPDQCHLVLVALFRCDEGMFSRLSECLSVGVHSLMHAHAKFTQK